jgi:hypothetical protein
MADRPSKLTAEIATEICRPLADGENLRAICRDDGTPNERAARRWALDEKEFGDLYAQALHRLRLDLRPDPRDCRHASDRHPRR